MAALLIVAAGALATLAVLLASALRLASLGSSLPLRLLAGGPLVLGIGMAALWLSGRQIPLRELRRPGALALAAVSVLVVVGLPLRWLLGLFGGAEAVGPFEAGLLVAAVAGLATAGVLASQAPGGELVAWLRRPIVAGASRGELLLLGFVLVLFGAVVVRLIVVRPVMGFDESIYALTSRWWVTGMPNTGWSAHRSPGLSLLGILAVPFSPAEAPFRVIGLLFGLGALVAVWRLGRELAGPAAGLVGALAAATILDFQLNAAAFLTDVPSAALLVFLVLLAWRRFETSPPTIAEQRALLVLAPLAAVTFYVRYGAAVPIVMLAISVCLLWPGRILRWWRWALATAGLLLVLLAPHMIFATSILGTPWGIALSARNLAAPAYVGQALQIYLGGFFTTVAGPIAGAVAVVGLVAAIAHLLRARRVDRQARAFLLVLLPALAVMLVLGLLTLAQTRYIYPSLLLLTVAGGMGIAAAWHRLPVLLRAAGGVLAFAVVAIAMLNAGTTMVASQAAYARTQRDLVEASERIRADALARAVGAGAVGAGADCSVLAYPVPEVTWYSGCATYHFDYPAAPGRDALLSGRHRYLMLLAGSTIRQPRGAMLQGYLRLVEPQPFAIVRDQASGEVAIRIYRFLVPGG